MIAVTAGPSMVFCMLFQQVQSDSISQTFSRVLSSLLVYCRARLHNATGMSPAGSTLVSDWVMGATEVVSQVSPCVLSLLCMTAQMARVSYLHRLQWATSCH